MAVVEEINDEDIRPTSSNDVNPTESGFLGSLANSIFEVSILPQSDFLRMSANRVVSQE